MASFVWSTRAPLTRAKPKAQRAFDSELAVATPLRGGPYKASDSKQL